jgi:hypothetical protein
MNDKINITDPGIAEKLARQDKQHQLNEVIAGVIGLAAGAGAVLCAPKVGFSYVILAVVLIWLGGCVLYADTYD